MNKFYNTFLKLIFFTGILVYSSRSVAQVLTRDSLALVSLYNSTGGSGWLDHANWLSGNVPTWYGVSVKGGRVSSLSLGSDNLTGAVPATLANLDSVRNIDFSNNKLTSMAALTGLNLDTLSVQNNKLTFKDLIPNKTVTDSFFYSPQDSVDIAIDTIVTEQSSVTLTTSVDQNPSVGDNYQWIFNNSTALVSGASASYTIPCMDSSKAGLYNVVITNLQLPRLALYRRTIDVLVMRLAQPDSGFHVCSSTNTLNAAQPAGSTVMWSVISGGAILASDTTPTTSVTNLSVGPNVFQYAVSSGNVSCPAGTMSTAVVVITRDTNPSPAYAGPDQSICGPQVTLHADSPSVGVGTWTVISGSSVVAQPNSPTSAANGLSVGQNIYRWQIVNGACAPAFFDEIIAYRDDTLSAVSAGRDTSICPTQYNLSAQLPADAHGMWSVTTGAGTFALVDSPQTLISGLADSTNVLTWTVSNTCNTVAENVKVTVYPFTIANAGPDQHVFYSPVNQYALGDTLAVGSGGNGHYTYVWSPSTYLDSADTEHPLFKTPDSGSYTYSVTVTDGHGCTASSAVNYYVTEGIYLAVPTLFTPSCNCQNNVFYIAGIESYPGNELTVVDRNDQVVYQKSDYQNDWGGINERGFSQQGSKLPADTYFYTLKLGDGRKTQTGFFLIKY